MSDEPRVTGYYDYPVVRRPVWTWEIPVYFWLGGIGGGAFITSSVAQRFGSKEDARTLANGFYLATAALLPCTPLLIKDLGRPDRFHHMLRVFKPVSPMNLGAWTLAAFTPLAMARAAAVAAESDRTPGAFRWLMRLLPRRITEMAGSLLGLTLAGYTGVLLAATNVPLWAKSKLLGGLFTASALSSGSAAVGLLATRRGATDQLLQRLSLIESAISATELALLAAFVKQSGRSCRPLTRGRLAPTFWLGAVGIGSVLPLLLHRLPSGGSSPGKRRLGSLASGCAILGSLALRFAVFEAGKLSAGDQAASFDLSS